MTSARRKAAWAVAAGLVTIGTIGIVIDRRPGGWDAALYEARMRYLQHIPPLTWPRDTFSPEAWKQTAPDERYRFVKSLLSSHQLKGRTPSEVDGLLGGMRADHRSCLDHVGAGDDQCTYAVRRVRSQNLWWILVLDFRDGRVSEARRALAYLDP